MRRKLFLYVWLLTPVMLLAYHYGPGQTGLARDAAAQQIEAARNLESKEDWKGAMAAYADALAKLPPTDSSTRWQLRLAQARARMQSGELPESITDFENLLADEEKADAAPAEIEEARKNLGMAQYYAAWLMRLEGAKTEEWSMQAESARQQFRLLAEDKLSTGAASAKGYEESLEATIRLARMDLSELQGLPLPKQCQGCKNVSQKCRGQCESKGKKPVDKKSKDARGAGNGERPPGGS